MEAFTNFSLPLSLQHLLWTTGTAFCCGIVLARLMLNFALSGQEKSFVRRKRLSNLFLMNLALLCLLADLLLTAGQGLRPSLWFWTGGLSLFFCFMFCFPRAIGLPCIILFLILGVMFFRTLRHFHFYTQNQTIVDVRVWKNGPNTSQREFHLYFPVTTLEFPSRHFYREVSSASWIPSELLSFHTPSDSLLEGVHLFSLKTKAELDLVAQILWRMAEILGWAKVIQPKFEHHVKEFYLYRLRTGQENPVPEFHWIVSKPQTELK